MSGYCIRCGEPLPDGALFCPGCGSKIATASAEGVFSVQDNCARGANGIERETSLPMDCAVSEDAQEDDSSYAQVSPQADIDNDGAGLPPIEESVKERTEPCLEQAAAKPAPEGKRFPRKLVWLAVAVPVVIAVVVVGVLASADSSLPSSKREPGKLPNYPVAMAQIEEWNDYEAIYETLNGDDRDDDDNGITDTVFDGDLLFTLSDALRYRTTMASVQVWDDQRIQLCFQSNVDSIGEEWEMRLWDGELLLMPINGFRTDLIITEDTADAYAQYMVPDYLPNREILNFSSKDAINLLAELSIQSDGDALIAEYTDFYPLFPALRNEIAKGKRESFGSEYHYVITTKDVGGQVFYVDVCSFNRILPIYKSKSPYYAETQKADIITFISTQSITVDASRDQPNLDVSEKATRYSEALTLSAIYEQKATEAQRGLSLAENTDSSDLTTYPDDAGILTNAAARNSYNLFLSNFTETGMGNIENTATADATELVRFALSHDGINSPGNWESATGEYKTNRELATRIDELVWRYMGATVNYGDLSGGKPFTRYDDYVYFNPADVATSPQGVASVTGSERIGSKMFKVYFSVYSGSYDATDQSLYSCSEEELNKRFGSHGSAYKGVATIMAGGNDEYTDGLSLLSYKRI